MGHCRWPISTAVVCPTTTMWKTCWMASVRSLHCCDDSPARYIAWNGCALCRPLVLSATVNLCIFCTPLPSSTHVWFLSNIHGMNTRRRLARAWADIAAADSHSWQHSVWAFHEPCRIATAPHISLNVIEHLAIGASATQGCGQYHYCCWMICPIWPISSVGSMIFLLCRCAGPETESINW